MADKTKVWMPVYIGDLLADTGHLTPAEFGAYHYILYQQWRMGPIPDRSLKAVTRLSDAQWSESEGTLKAFLCLDADGHWYQSRALKEKRKSDAVSERNKANGSNGGRPPNEPNENPEHNPDETQTQTQIEPKAKAKPNPELTPSPSQSPLPPKEEKDVSTPSESHPAAVRQGAEAKHPDLLIYEKYPRREGKRAAMKAIAAAVSRISKGEKLDTSGVFHDPCGPMDARRKLFKAVAEFECSPAGKNPDKTKIPHPATWFNEGRYMDDRMAWRNVPGARSASQPSGPGPDMLAVIRARSAAAQAEIAAEAAAAGGGSHVA